MLTSPSTESGTTTQEEIITEKTAVEIQNIASEIDAMLRRTDSRESIDKEETTKEEKVAIRTTTTTTVETVKKEEDHEEPLKNVTEIAPKEEEEKPREINNNEPDDAIPVAVDKEAKEGGIVSADKNVQPEEEQEEANPRVESPSDEEDKRTTKEPSPSSNLVSTIEIEIVEQQPVVTSVSSVTLPANKDTRNSLRIVESEDEDDKLLPPPPPSTTSSDPYKNVVVEMEKYDVRFVPLKGDDSPADTTSPRVNGDGAKTVKDIIDSINKSQSLLKINVEDQKRRASNGSINTRIRELERKESECNEMLNEIDLDQKIGSLRPLSPVPDEEIPVVIRDLQSMKTDDEVNALFKKCRPASGSGNHDWNPLPKPKRSHSSSPSTPN